MCTIGAFTYFFCISAAKCPCKEHQIALEHINQVEKWKNCGYTSVNAAIEAVDPITSTVTYEKCDETSTISTVTVCNGTQQQPTSTIFSECPCYGCGPSHIRYEYKKEPCIPDVVCMCEK